jgi:molybdopterin synthase sulfur carrier subunit
VPVVTLRAPIKDLAGGHAEVELDGTTVGEVLRALEARWPKTVGWVLDERGHVRRHVNVFVNGERVREDAAVTPADHLHVLPSISGGGR